MTIRIPDQLDSSIQFFASYLRDSDQALEKFWICEVLSVLELEKPGHLSDTAEIPNGTDRNQATTNACTDGCIESNHVHESLLLRATPY